MFEKLGKKLGLSLCCVGVASVGYASNIEKWITGERSSADFKAVPQAALDVLNSLPDQKITMNLIVGTGLKNSDSFDQIKAGYLTTQAPEYAAKAKHDYKWTLAGQLVDNENEPVGSSFAPISVKTSGVSTELATFLPTGTALSLKLAQGEGAITYPPQLGMGTLNYNEAKWVVGLQQNLWKDAFGRTSRRLLETSRQERLVLEKKLESSTQDWTLNLMNFYYSAWFSQMNARASFESLQRRQRLKNITTLRLKRGTAERPDLLQVESAVIDAEARLSDAEQTSQDIWRNLVSNLKFPREWMAINAVQIPLALDAPTDDAIKACGAAEKLNTTPQSTAEVEVAKLQQQNSERNFEAAQDALNPNLTLGLEANFNGVDSTRLATAWQESLGAENPSLAGVLTMSIPLGRFGEKAQFAQAASQNIVAKAALSMAQNALEVDWINQCQSLFRLRQKAANLKEVLAKQTERLRLEERRFEYGQVTVDRVIMAGDELTLAELNYLRAEMDLRMSAWKVKKLDGSLLSYIKGFEKLAQASPK